MRDSEIQISNMEDGVGEGIQIQIEQDGHKTDVVKRQTADELIMGGGSGRGKTIEGGKKWSNRREQRVPVQLVDT